MKKFRMKICLLIFACCICASLCSCGFIGASDSAEKQAEENKVSVTITLNPNGGTASQLTLVGYAGEPMTLPVPERDGYTFDKWYNDFQIIDQTIFPSSNMTLTARYYAQTDSIKQIKYTSQLNQSYSSFVFSLEGFSKEDQERILYLQRNYETELKINCSFEAYLSTSSFARTVLGASGEYQLSGANVIGSISTNAENWTKYSVESFKTGAELVNTGKGILRLSTSVNLGSTTAYFRNAVLTMEYTEKAGTLV